LRAVEIDYGLGRMGWTIMMKMIIKRGRNAILRVGMPKNEIKLEIEKQNEIWKATAKKNLVVGK
jgi:hypothetical protein